MSGWQLATGMPVEAASAFADLPTVFALTGEAIARDPLSEVIRVECGGLRYYVKRYWAA